MVLNGLATAAASFNRQQPLSGILNMYCCVYFTRSVTLISSASESLRMPKTTSSRDVKVHFKVIVFSDPLWMTYFHLIWWTIFWKWKSELYNPQKSPTYSNNDYNWFVKFFEILWWQVYFVFRKIKKKSLVTCNGTENTATLVCM